MTEEKIVEAGDKPISSQESSEFVIPSDFGEQMEELMYGVMRMNRQLARMDDNMTKRFERL